MPEGTDVTVTANFAAASPPGTGVYIGTTQLRVGTYYTVSNGELTGNDTQPDDNYARLTGNATDGYTLTLRNFAYKGQKHQVDEFYYAALSANGALTLDLVGINSIAVDAGEPGTSGSCGVYVGGKLTVTGGGSLTATGGATTNEDFGSYGVHGRSDILVESGTLTGIGGSGGTGSTGVYGSSLRVDAGGTLIAKGGQVTGNVGNSCGVSVVPSDSSGITVYGTLTATGGTAAGGGYSCGVSVTPLSNGITVYGTLTATGGTGGTGGSYGIYKGNWLDNNILVTFTGEHMTVQGNDQAFNITTTILPTDDADDFAYIWRTSNDGEWNSEPYSYNMADPEQYLEMREGYTLTVTQPTSGGSISGVSPVSNVAVGDKVTLTASAVDGYTFSDWTVDGVDNLTGSTNPTLTFTMPNRDVTVTAPPPGIPPAGTTLRTRSPTLTTGMRSPSTWAARPRCPARSSKKSLGRMWTWSSSWTTIFPGR